MRRLRQGGIALAVLLGLAMPALAGDQDGQSSSGGSGLLATLFGQTGKKPESMDDKPIVVAPVSTERASTLFEREQGTLLRRMEVCGKLKEIALQAGDQEQLNRIEQLEERIWPLYQQRTANLPVSPAVAREDNARLDQTRSPLGRQPSPDSGRSANLGGDAK